MKKALFFLFLAFYSFSAASSFTIEMPNRRIFIDGTAIRPYLLEYFHSNFTFEALGTGYTIAENKDDAGFIFKFDVALNPNRNLDPNHYIITISLINNANDTEILSFDFFFTHIEEMYLYNQFLFFRAISIIPPITEEDIIVSGDIEAGHLSVLDTSWKDKWLYLRASLEYPMTFYILQPKGLIGGIGIYDGDYDDPNRVSPLDHKILAMPGITFGLELQFLNFMSFGLNLQLSLGDTINAGFINTAIGAELKFPLKYFSGFLIEPYAACYFPLTVSDIFAKFPSSVFGGGLQIGTRGGKNGVFFVDIKYLMSIANAGMYNQFEDLFPEPSVTYYKRDFLGIGIGYK
ncbi:MAG: hypothetical protein LBC80_07025 [Treponema sp.]|jgi:hypothetical protein|nr:hypothetical protein [Treponema sp.]